MPLATMLRSIAEHNQSSWPLSVTVLNDGFSEGAQHRVFQSLPAHSVRVRWTTVDLDAFAHFGRLDHVSAMTYARLQIPRLLPESVTRVLYLDADMLALGDLTALQHAKLDGAPIGAVRDHYVDANLKAGRVDRTAGVPRVKDYFNAGVLLIDLEACRRTGHFDRAVEYLQTHPRTPYADQDALNVAFDGRWKQLDGRWNFQNHHTTRIDRIPVTERPAIVHFITSTKPWKPSSCSINASLHNCYRSRTWFRRTIAEEAWAATATFAHRLRARLSRLQRRASAVGTRPGTGPASDRTEA